MKKISKLYKSVPMITSAEYCASLHAKLAKAERKVEEMNNKLNEAVARLPVEQLSKYVNLTLNDGYK